MQILKLLLFSSLISFCAIPIIGAQQNPNPFFNKGAPANRGIINMPRTMPAPANLGSPNMGVRPMMPSNFRNMQTPNLPRMQTPAVNPFIHTPPTSNPFLPRQQMIRQNLGFPTPQPLRSQPLLPNQNLHNRFLQKLPQKSIGQPFPGYQRSLRTPSQVPLNQLRGTPSQVIKQPFSPYRPTLNRFGGNQPSVTKPVNYPNLPSFRNLPMTRSGINPTGLQRPRFPSGINAALIAGTIPVLVNNSYFNRPYNYPHPYYPKHSNFYINYYVVNPNPYFTFQVSSYYPSYLPYNFYPYRYGLPFSSLYYLYSYPYTSNYYNSYLYSCTFCNYPIVSYDTGPIVRSTKPRYQWVKAENGNVPENAVIYENKEKQDQVYYYCQAAFKKRLYYGWLIPQDACYATDNKVTLRFDSYKVLVEL